MEEAAYRIDYPLAYARSTRVVAFDEIAEETVRSVSGGPWGQAQFYTASDSGGELITLEGQRRPMLLEIDQSDSVVMVATNSVVSAAAAAVGAACRERSIMTAGLLLLDAGPLGGEALSALRPYARILLVPADKDDLFELLRAIRA
ncbi:hypothetical protein ACQ3I4_06715 [Zafaria sp. Z1313]|uniref:hypothetical protein n=1 Tax=Zafaria sp. Z1313 TaxID=3423202 RepID=UPI003D303300